MSLVMSLVRKGERQVDAAGEKVQKGQSHYTALHQLPNLPSSPCSCICIRLCLYISICNCIYLCGWVKRCRKAALITAPPSLHPIPPTPPEKIPLSWHFLTLLEDLLFNEIWDSFILWDYQEYKISVNFLLKFSLKPNKKFSGQSSQKIWNI